MTETLDYRVVDVFTAEAFRGNPLAVVLGGDDLRTAQCQALAREFNLSETAFPIATTTGADYRLRIFTAATELAFAGHPSVGAAWVQREVGAVVPRDGAIVQECGAGLLPLRFLDEEFIELTGGESEVAAAQALSPDLAAGCGLDAADVVGGVRAASTGNPFLVVPITEAALVRATPQPGLAKAAATTGGGGVLLLSWDGDAHVRIFAPALGVPEDPATGSAATALCCYLVAEGMVATEGETRFEIRQGAEMGRPSLLRGRVVATAGRAVSAHVAGQVAPVAEGKIRIPPGG